MRVFFSRMSTLIYQPRTTAEWIEAIRAVEDWTMIAYLGGIISHRNRLCRLMMI